MSEFYRETAVKNPRAEYVCEWCGLPITGRHLYIVGKSANSDFMASRVHEECHNLMRHGYCAGCRDNDPCLSWYDCYRDAKSKENGK